MSRSIRLVSLALSGSSILDHACESVSQQVHARLGLKSHFLSGADVKSEILETWNKWTDNKKYRTDLILEWLPSALSRFEIPFQDIQLIITDVEFLPRDRTKRYEIFVIATSSDARIALVSITTLDPRYWNEVGYEPREKKIAQRLYIVCLRIIAQLLGLSNCHELSCPLCERFDSIRTIDQMTDYCVYHDLQFKAVLQKWQQVQVNNISSVLNHETDMSVRPSTESIISRKESAMGQHLEPPLERNHSTQPPREYTHRPLCVFLCHSSGDKSTVRKLYRQLRAEGIDPWLDEENLIPGQEWQLEIPKAVRASDVVLVCLSRNSVGKMGYLQKEIRNILDVAEEQPEGTTFVIPLRLEECDVPERLHRWQWVNYFEEKGYDRLILALQKRAEDLEAKITE